MTVGVTELETLLDNVVGSLKGQINVSLPGTVVSYDPLTQTATVKPSISMRVARPELGAPAHEPFQPIPGVPVWFPGNGLANITFDIPPGTSVSLIACDRSLTEWKATGLPENAPVSPRRFSVSDFVAYPGLLPTVRPRLPTAVAVSPGSVVVSGLTIHIGSTAAAQSIALAPLVKLLFNKFLQWIGAHTHTAPSGGGITSPPDPNPFNPPPDVQGSIIGSTRIFGE